MGAEESNRCGSLHGETTSGNVTLVRGQGFKNYEESQCCYLEVTMEVS